MPSHPGKKPKKPNKIATKIAEPPKKNTGVENKGVEKKDGGRNTGV